MLASLLAVLAWSPGQASLPWSDVNLLIVTDVHSWVAGHPHKDHTPALDADYGAVLSLYERLAASAAQGGRDLFFVQNGDLNDGTGLSRVPPATLLPLIQKMPFDALTTGNHELYHNETIEYLARPHGFIDGWRGAFLTSNVLNATTRQPLGARSKLLVGGATGVRLLTFGFLYDMTDHADGVAVTAVEDAVQMPWFVEALKRRESYDALLFLAHMDYRDRLVDVLHSAARAIVGSHVPILFVTGHSHIRAYRDLDPRAASFEAGHYLDTVGFASFALDGSARAMNSAADGSTDGSTSSFEHVYIKANVAVMAAAAGLDDPALLATPAGSALSSNISRAASSLGLDRQLGCSPTKYLTYAPLNTADSLWGLYLYNVTATQALGGNSSRVVVESTGSLRYDLYAGRVTVNDLWTMTPFADQFWRVSAAGVSGEDLAAILRELNAHGTLSSTRGPQEHMRAVSGGTLPAYASTSEPLPGKVYELWTLSFDRQAVVRAFKAQTKRMASPKLMLDGANTTSVWEKWIERAWPCHGPGMETRARED